ncbi:cobalt-zinc-cadmium efflux system outer membrane protein [Thermonema lapsum]|uniref:Cobalt-zinc-cadmium efflux system outer membrane protein n=1 Tax=Thermonema lapsum TaxID=28195 RepID=A0A846MQ46_9BACT|nr:TolC family protein [Thermonema lapsum]NIK73575.1 cobalt-zinc-cadmium efflux system outer membrane protein [Thermonema lapsum]
MSIPKYAGVTIISFIFYIQAIAQDTLKLNRQQCEAIFLKENLLLIAERLEISKAEAMKLQASLWPNPTVSLDEINLWATQKQLGVFGEELPGFNGGNFGRNQQISFSIEQLILTAGKRKKLMALEQVNVDKSQQYFQDLLRHLKYEFRLQLTQLQYLQFKRAIYLNQISSVRQLTHAYQRQVDLGNIPKGEYIRLKALELEISKQINELNKEINEVQKELKLLMRLPANVYLILSDDDYLKNIESFKSLSLSALLDTAKSIRPDLKLAELEQTYFSKLYAYEKAQRTPNLTLKGGYDRGGNFMYNFVGFGVAMDLPIFNRNQGNIRYANLGIEQSKILYEQQFLTVANEIALAWQNLNTSIRFFESIEPNYEKTLDDLLNAYTKNLANRSISLLEYLDFLDAYLENKRIILEAAKDVNDKAEELNFSLGIDLIK